MTPAGAGTARELGHFPVAQHSVAAALYSGVTNAVLAALPLRPYNRAPTAEAAGDVSSP